MAQYQRRPSAAPQRGRPSNSRSGGRSSGSAPSRRSPAGSGRSGGSGRNVKNAPRKPSGAKGSPNRSSSRNSGGKAQQRSRPSSGGDSGFSGFYKAMTLLAVAGLFAALYFGGYLENIGLSEKLGGLLGEFGLTGSLQSEASPSAPAVSEEEISSETTVVITTTAAPATTTEATTTTTTAAPREPGHDAEYVEEPDYRSPYYIVVYTGSQSVLVLGKDSDGYYNVKAKCFTCSTGASGTPTRTGLYSILRTYRWRELLGDVYGQYCSSFSGSYLFHSILYEDKDNSTLFPNSYNNLGYAASHGCVRLCVRDAKWIFDNCPKGTQVHVVNAEGPEGESYLPELIDSSKYYGWDPTDPDEDNPYNR